MARFYGTIQGARGPASRLGHANSGLEVTAQSYSGDVEVLMGAGYGARKDEDHVNIRVRPHAGSDGAWNIVSIYQGPIQALLGPSREVELAMYRVKHLTTPEKIELYDELGRQLMLLPAREDA